MRIVVTGTTGQVGGELMRVRWPAGFNPVAADRTQLDLAAGPDAIAAAVKRLRPDVLINAAAFTAVDRAESESAAAHKVNADGVGHLAAACAKAKVPLIHISTDYVFDGSKAGPYTEDDPVAPLGVYGASKEAGERAIRAVQPQHVILRTAWVYSPLGQNFVKTMLRLAAERDELRVVCDQIGCPTSARDVAGAAMMVCAHIATGGKAWGTYHFTAAGRASWHELAETVIAWSASRTGRRPRVTPISTAEYPTPARRPANSVLDSNRVGPAFGIASRPWREGLRETLDELLPVQAAFAKGE